MSSLKSAKVSACDFVIPVLDLLKTPPISLIESSSKYFVDGSIVKALPIPEIRLGTL